MGLVPTVVVKISDRGLRLDPWLIETLHVCVRPPTGPGARHAPLVLVCLSVMVRILGFMWGLADNC